VKQHVAVTIFTNTGGTYITSEKIVLVANDTFGVLLFGYQE